MNWAASIYVDENGTVYGASLTDQKGCHKQLDRTVGGEPVEFAGKWYGSQMNYQPYKDAVKAAAVRAYNRKTILDRIVEATS